MHLFVGAPSDVDFSKVNANFNFEESNCEPCFFASTNINIDFNKSMIRPKYALHVSLCSWAPNDSYLCTRGKRVDAKKRGGWFSIDNLMSKFEIIADIYHSNGCFKKLPKALHTTLVCYKETRQISFSFFIVELSSSFQSNLCYYNLK